MKTTTPAFKILKALQKKKAPGLWRKHQMLCRSRSWKESAVLKLQKKSWTRNGMGEGLFFSIWIDDDDLKKGRFNYNIHALKLRLWKSHQIKPRKFASTFRSKLKPFRKKWPNLQTSFGPQTLMQGWVSLDPQTLEHEAARLVDAFVGIHGILDEMLDERKKP